MKSTNSFKVIFFLTIFCFVLLVNNITAQVQTPEYYSITTNTNGYYEYLPKDYSIGSESYPLIIFIGGYGECGDGSETDLPKVLHFGPPMQISQGIFPDSFVVKGQTFEFIVISPQFTQLPKPSEINDVISYILQKYRVDPKRIYMTGASMGGGVCWDYAGNNINYANRIAAMVPICGASYPDVTKANNIAAADIAVWATHSVDDIDVPSAYTTEYINLINAASIPPDPLAKETLFPGSDHNAWTPTYNLNFKEDSVNVYEWMLQYQRSFVVLPVTGLQFNVAKTSNEKIQVNWQIYNEKNLSGYEVQRSNNGISFETITAIASHNIDNSKYTFTDQLPVQGKNYYRIKITSLNNEISYSLIKVIDVNKDNPISIFPNPVTNILNLITQNTFTNAQLKIINADGKTVKKILISGTGNIPLSVEKLSSGVYAAEIISAGRIFKIMFVKQ